MFRVEWRRWWLWKASLDSNTTDWSSSRLGQLRRVMRSVLSVAKTVSATALSNASPREPIEIAIPARAGPPAGERHVLTVSRCRDRLAFSAWPPR